MFKVLILCGIMMLQTSIYSIHFNDSTGVDRTMNQFAGKRILIVNIASGSNKVSQLSELQQLYTQYHDSLEIVAFPSNSFNHEPLGNNAIKLFCQNSYGVTFSIAAKGPVAGSGPQPIYSWLNNASENGTASFIPTSDFYKILIDKDGSLIGAFAPRISPTDSLIIHAITGN